MRSVCVAVVVMVGVVGMAAGASASTPPHAQHVELSDVTVLDGEKLEHRPGQVFVLPSGKYKKLTIRNFKGEARRPVMFINAGLVEINNTDLGGGAIDIRHCQHVRLTGSGPRGAVTDDPYASRCGIRIACGERGPHALNVVNRSSDIEIDHIEVYGAGFAGFNVKDETSTVTRDQFTMYRMSIHDNYVHHTKGEGFYIGHTFFDGYDPKKTGRPVLPHVIRGLRVYNNVTVKTGCEGIQVGSAVSDARIYNNTIIDSGTDPFAKWQDNGMQIGAGTRAVVYNNVIRGCPGVGMVIFGHEELTVYNNVVVDAGAIGMYVNTKGGQRYVLAHNTIVHPGSDGVRIGNWRNPPAKVTVVNNIIITKPGATDPKTRKPVRGIANQNRQAALDDKPNLVTNNIEKVGFAGEGCYRLTAGSPARSAGRSLRALGITADIDSTTRLGTRVDMGAWTYRSGTEPGAATDRAPQALDEPQPWDQPAGR
jgi:hypothetical protein